MAAIPQTIDPISELTTFDMEIIGNNPKLTVEKWKSFSYATKYYYRNKEKLRKKENELRHKNKASRKRIEIEMKVRELKLNPADITLDNLTKLCAEMKNLDVFMRTQIREAEAMTEYWKEKACKTRMTSFEYKDYDEIKMLLHITDQKLFEATRGMSHFKYKYKKAKREIKRLKTKTIIKIDTIKEDDNETDDSDVEESESSVSEDENTIIHDLSDSSLD